MDQIECRPISSLHGQAPPSTENSVEPKGSGGSFSMERENATVRDRVWNFIVKQIPANSHMHNKCGGEKSLLSTIFFLFLVSTHV